MELYILFCLTTAIVGILQIYNPVHKMLLDKHADNVVTNAPILSHILFLVFGAITAPALFIVLMIHPAKESFINNMFESIIKD